MAPNKMSHLHGGTERTSHWWAPMFWQMFHGRLQAGVVESKLSRANSDSDMSNCIKIQHTIRITAGGFSKAIFHTRQRTELCNVLFQEDSNPIFEISYNLKYVNCNIFKSEADLW